MADIKRRLRSDNRVLNLGSSGEWETDQGEHGGRSPDSTLERPA